MQLQMLVQPATPPLLASPLSWMNHGWKRSAYQNQFVLLSDTQQAVGLGHPCISFGVCFLFLASIGRGLSVDNDTRPNKNEGPISRPLVNQFLSCGTSLCRRSRYKHPS